MERERRRQGMSSDNYESPDYISEILKGSRGIEGCTRWVMVGGDVVASETVPTLARSTS